MQSNGLGLNLRYDTMSEVYIKVISPLSSILLQWSFLLLFASHLLQSGLQDKFVATMHTIVTRKQTVMVKKEEGWYSYDEMKNDLGWSES